jgi:hypothetical protein
VSSCRVCGCTNDFDANFCQACGTQQTEPTVTDERGPFDFVSIDHQLSSFRDTFRKKPYECQKASLEDRLVSFLASCIPAKSPLSCTGVDVVRFLIRSCERPSSNARHRPSRLAASTVKNMIGKLRLETHSVFHLVGERSSCSILHLARPYGERASNRVLPSCYLPYNSPYAPCFGSSITWTTVGRSDYILGMSFRRLSCKPMFLRNPTSALQYTTA